jgi:hypothetical protein
MEFESLLSLFGAPSKRRHPSSGRIPIDSLLNIPQQHPTVAAMSRCPRCKEELDEGAFQCSHCGETVRRDSPRAEKFKSKPLPTAPDTTLRATTPPPGPERCYAAPPPPSNTPVAPPMTTVQIPKAPTSVFVAVLVTVSLFCTVPALLIGWVPLLGFLTIGGLGLGTILSVVALVVAKTQNSRMLWPKVALFVTLGGYIMVTLQILGLVGFVQKIDKEITRVEAERQRQYSAPSNQSLMTTPAPPPSTGSAAPAAGALVSGLQDSLNNQLNKHVAPPASTFASQWQSRINQNGTNRAQSSAMGRTARTPLPSPTTNNAQVAELENLAKRYDAEVKAKQAAGDIAGAQQAAIRAQEYRMLARSKK